MPEVSAIPQRLVLASRNRGKLAELSLLLGPLGASLHSVSEFSATEVAEPAPTFVENALLKARHAAQVSGLAAIADDSGIEVPALGGAPGVHSARYAGPGADDAANLRQLLQALDGRSKGERAARFVSVIVLLRSPDDPTPLIAQGHWWGEVLPAPRGTTGFGYDPVFGIPHLGLSAAELAPEIKAQLSHRGQAIRALLAQLQAAGP